MQFKIILIVEVNDEVVASELKESLSDECRSLLDPAADEKFICADLEQV